MAERKVQPTDTAANAPKPTAKKAATRETKISKWPEVRSTRTTRAGKCP